MKLSSEENRWIMVKEVREYRMKAQVMKKKNPSNKENPAGKKVN